VYRGGEINPEEIFLDSSNLPSLDEAQFEGRVEFPINPLGIVGVGVVFVLGALAFLSQAFNLQVVHGDEYAEVSRENRIERSVIFASRGVIYDRTGRALAWNEAPGTSTVATSTRPFALRRYTDLPGLAHVLGYVNYPRQDDSGAWWREDYTGISGVEFTANASLRGINGNLLIERDARGKTKREDMVVPPSDGSDEKLAIDAEVQSKLFSILSAHAETYKFRGGAAAIMDVATGELLALTSFPEYDNDAFSGGDSDIVAKTNTDPRAPLLNRAVAGVYTPGSIVKPVFAVGALAENIIHPEKKILSTGQLVVPNP
jgi:penicillin-binding protein 2